MAAMVVVVFAVPMRVGILDCKIVLLDRAVCEVYGQFLFSILLLMVSVVLILALLVEHANHAHL